MKIYSLIKFSQGDCRIIKHYFDEAGANRAKQRAQSRNRGGESTFHVIKKKITGKLFIELKDVKFVRNTIKAICNRVEHS